jgi:hypothetical protein
MLWRWDKFLKEGDELFDYMTNNFETICSNENITHFDIVDRRYRFTDEVQRIKDKYMSDIHMQLYNWIKGQCDCKQLFNKGNWKPFRDQEILIDMFFGYKYMFQYQQYFFQLCIEDDCDIDNCISNIHFKLVLYGWKNDMQEKLQPDDRVVIPSDNVMPEEYWNRT